MKKKKVEAKKSVIYCGPTVPHLVRRYTSFVDGILPAELQAFIDENPVFKELIVSVNKLADASRQLRNPHSSLSVFYEKAQTILKNKGG